MRAYTSGSCRRIQSSFGAVKPVSARLPVSSISRSRPTRSSISAHSAAVRWSFQRIAGRSARVVRVERDEAVHLARVAERIACLPAELRQRRSARAPPVLWILLGPAGLGVESGYSSRRGRAPRRPARSRSP